MISYHFYGYDFAAFDLICECIAFIVLCRIEDLEC